MGERLADLPFGMARQTYKARGDLASEAIIDSACTQPVAGHLHRIAYGVPIVSIETRKQGLLIILHHGRLLQWPYFCMRRTNASLPPSSRCSIWPLTSSTVPTLETVPCLPSDANTNTRSASPSTGMFGLCVTKMSWRLALTSRKLLTMVS